MADAIALYGTDLFGDAIQPPRRGPIAENFLVPPFTILNAREGFWQERKAAWISTGIKSELGRDGGACYNIGLNANKENNWSTSDNKGSGTSIFDPVLCELSYRWFCPSGGIVVDPFAGGSVRGIVAGLLGYRYWGCDLSEKQILANQEQARSIAPDVMPTWVIGDSLYALELSPPADLIFTCPPYGDLEKYSDDPRDISNMEYHTFLPAFKRILLRCWQRLKENRFAVIVVGEFRDSKGFYRNFVGDTINAFKEIGFHYYNEAILVTAVGSLPIRITKQFEASRKMGKTHQNVLVFVKGDPREATRNIGNENA